MKPKPFLRSLLIGSSLLAAPALQATTLTWDANNTGANQTDGAGAWLGTNQWWDGINNVDWTSYVAPDAIFGNGTAGGAVTLASPTTVGSLTFNRFGSGSTYTIGTAGQALTINSGITINHNNLTSATAVTNNSVSIISNVVLGGAQTWLNNAYSPMPKTDSSSLSVQGGINLNGHALTIDGIGTTNLGQVTGNIISGSGGIIKNGTGTLNLGGIGGSPVNTYTGGTTINGGIVRFNATDTPGTSGSFGAGGITINNGIIEGYFGGTFSRSLGSGSSNVQILGGTSGFSGQGGTGTSFTIGTSGSALQFGSTHFFPTGGVFVLQSDRVNTAGKMTLNNGIDLNGANREITSLGGDTSGGATVKNAIVNTGGGTFGLTKSGAGNLILEAGGTYTGATTINGGWWYNNSNANVYTGWLTLSTATGSLNSTNALNLNGGTLRLVNTAQVDRFRDASAIAVTGGGGISYENSGASINFTETVGALTMNSGTTAITLLGDFAAAAGSQKLTLGNLTQNGTSTVFVSAGNTATTAPSATKNMIQVTGKSGLGAGQGTAATIIGPWATTGGSATLQTDYAVYDGSGFIVPAAITSSTSGSWTDSTKAYSLNTGTLETLAADASAQALQFYGATSDLALGGFKLQTYGLLTSGSNAKTISGGTLTTPGGGGNLYITTGRTGVDTTLTTTAAIADNSGVVNLVKSGAGRLILQGNNTYSGDTVVNGGTLLIGISANTPGTPSSLGSLSGGTYTYAGNIYLNGGSTLQFRSTANQTLSGDISGNGNLIFQGSGTKILSGDNTYTGTTTIGPQAAAVGGLVLSVSSINSVFTNVGLGTVHSANSSLGAPTTMETGRITIGTGIQQSATLRYTGAGETTDRMINFAFNSSATYTVENTGGSSSLLKFVSTPMSNGTITGGITLGGSGNGEFTGGLPFNFTSLTKNDGGTWTLGGAVGSGNGTSGAGVVTVNAGTLALQKKVSIMGGDMTKWTNAKINVKNGATLALNVDSADANGISASSLNTLLGNISTGITSATLGLQAGARIGLDTSTATGGSFTQGTAIADSTGSSGGAIGLTKLGTGTLVLDKTNTYTGSTIVSAGKLVINGSTSSTSLVTVASGATLGGIGTVGGATTISGTHSPGNSPGIQTFSSDLTYSGVSPSPVVNWELTGNTATNAANPNAIFDQIIVGGDLNFADATTLNLSFIAAGSNVLWGDTFWGANQSWTLYDVAGTTANFANLSLATTNWLDSGNNAFNTVRSGSYFSLSQSGEDVLINYTYVPVPEPRAALLGGLGLIMLLRRRR